MAATSDGAVTPADAGELILYLEKDPFWIRRRTERISCLERWTIMRETTVEVSLTAEWIRALPRSNDRFLLPVKTLARSGNLLISAALPDGSLLPTLARHDERRLVAEGLIPAYAALFPTHDVSEPFRIRLRTWLDSDATATTAPPTAARVVDEALAEQWTYLANVYRRKFLVIVGVALPASANATGYEGHVIIRHPELPIPRSVSAEPRWGRLKAAASGWRERRGAVVLEYLMAQLTKCRSFHVHLSCPPGTYVHEASLRGDVTGLRGPHRVDAVDDDPYPDRASVYVSVHPDWQESEVEFVAHLRPTTRGGMLAGLMTSWLTTVTIGWVLVVVGWAAAGWASFLPWRMPTDHSPPAVATTVLLGPTLLSAIIIRQGEHAMTKQVLNGHRWRVGSQAALAFATAATVASGLSGEWAGVVLATLFLGSALLSLADSVSYTVSKSQLKKYTS